MTQATLEFQRMSSAAVMKGCTRISVGSVSPRSATWMVWSMSPDTPMATLTRSALDSDPPGSSRLIRIWRFAVPGASVVTYDSRRSNDAVLSRIAVGHVTSRIASPNSLGAVDGAADGANVV